MAKFKNVSPLGALDIPTLGIVVEAGKSFDVPKDLVAYFADQPQNFKPVATGGKPKDEKPADEKPDDDSEKEADK